MNICSTICKKLHEVLQRPLLQFILLKIKFHAEFLIQMTIYAGKIFEGRSDDKIHLAREIFTGRGKNGGNDREIDRAKGRKQLSIDVWFIGFVDKNLRTLGRQDHIFDGIDL